MIHGQYNQTSEKARAHRIGCGLGDDDYSITIVQVRYVWFTCARELDFLIDVMASIVLGR